MMAKGALWTDYEMSVMRKLYPKKAARAVHEVLPHRTIEAIRTRAKGCGIFLLSRKTLDKVVTPVWPISQIDALKRAYPVSTIDELLAMFPGKSYNSIYRKAQRLGLAKNKQHKARKDVIKVQAVDAEDSKEYAIVRTHYAIGQWEGQPPPKAVRSVFELCGV